MNSKIVIEQVTIYTTSDAQEFRSLQSAERHQKELDLEGFLGSTTFDFSWYDASSSELAEKLMKHWDRIKLIVES